MDGVRILAGEPRRFKRDEPHQDVAAFPEQRRGPLQPSLYLEQCVEVTGHQ